MNNRGENLGSRKESKMLGKVEWVWVASDTKVPIGAKVKVTPSGQRLLVDDEGKERRLSQELEASLRIMHPTSAEGVDDMIKLRDMTEAGLLRNLWLRHKQSIIYTYIGSVLVAVNPYQDFPIYSSEQVRLYHGRKLGELPPHIFAVAESCYSHMIRYQRNQCCIVSGESGAGKTESTKLILQYLAAVSGELSEQQVERHIMESNPILEAFGNAKTTRNDNSSRFGKYLEIFFNKDGVIEGARVEQYLLEKSRVCHQAPDERNYHMFYCMLAGITADERKTLSLSDADEYTFLTKGYCVVCDGRDDAKDYQGIRSAMNLFFSEHQCGDILKLLAAILHLGNICFEAIMLNNMESSDVSTSEHFNTAASLLGVHESSLATSLTSRSFMTNRESVTKPLTSKQASDCRDAFVKAIYNKLFVWIVGKINNVIYQRLNKSPKSSFLSLGLLDIFGFENFDTNSFEQLCINFANEQLQQFFVDHIFKLEQEEYLQEDILWKNIKFNDNQDILDLLAGKPCNLLALVEEESQFPKGSDLTMLQKMNQHHTGNKHYITSKQGQETDFGILHFAGAVYYDSRGFLEKNRDAVSFDIIRMVDVSTNQLLHQIFEAGLPSNGIKITKNKRITVTPKNTMRVQADSKQVPTLTGQFRQSLDSLMKTLSTCHPFFIRCFKPNNNKRPQVFDRELCMDQLRYSGMMDTIRIRKLGYPIRHNFEDFLNRYRVLLDRTVCDPKTSTAATCCKAICRTVIPGKDEWKIGRTKIFLRDAHDTVLERLRERELNKVALVIQTFMRGHKDRMVFLRKRRAAVVLQNHWRAYRGKLKLLQFGFDRLTSRIHGRTLRSQYWRQRVAAITIQSHLRGYLVRKDLKRKSNAAILLQAYTRGMQARRAAENIRVRKNQDQIALDLQQRLLAIAQSQQFDEEPEPITEQDSGKNARDLQATPPVEESDGFKAEVDSTASVSPASTPPSEEADDFDENLDEFSFYRFSILHFQDNATHTHINKRLRQPLLHHEDEGDAMACLTVWWLILRFMGDLPEPRSPEATFQVSRPVSRNLPIRQARKQSSLVGLDEKIMRKKKKIGGRNKRPSIILEEPEDFTDDEDILIGDGPTLDRHLSPLEKLHIITGFALLRRGIRDEIYCQICKQLVNNKNTRSQMQGWTLLSICLGIFPPTDLFMKYLERFVCKGPSDYAAYCSERLDRLKANGERTEVPCLIELKAAKSKKPIEVCVALLDDRTVDLHLDSASTSAEVCQALADKINLRDTCGFSLYIALYDKVASLGSCGNHVLDAVSQCEQEMQRQGKKEKDTPWRLSFRKELFTPWHDCSVDPVSTDLIYRQIIKGIKSGKYTFEKEDESVHLAAMHYYIQFGSVYNKDDIQKVVDECVTTTLIKSESVTKWVDLIGSAHSQAPYVRTNQEREAVKGELVNTARLKWPLDFSKFYEVTMTSGPPLPKSKFHVAINWSGILFMDGKDNKLLELLYLEIKQVHTSIQSVNLATVRGDFVLKAEEAADMVALIEENLEGLRRRSVYAFARHKTRKHGDKIFLVCKRGDLLRVEKDEESSPDVNLIRATNQRTGSTGTVYKDRLQYLPTLSRPSEEMLELLRPGQKKRSASDHATQRDESETAAPVSLRDFARENFRPAGVVGQQGAFKTERLWVCSRELLRQPLMKSLMRNSELSSLACGAFTAILKYMGDYPIKHARHPIELTDQIFGPATQHEALQDEIYCQIMRQMTGNNIRSSMERGWQLMWLCTGMFLPSHNLMRPTQHFLESQPRDQLAAICLQRLQGMQSKQPRKFPPHLVELEAIQQNNTQIFQKVHFPNETNEIFEVTSTTTIKDLCCSIASELNISSADEYGLYLNTPKKITSMDENQYFFDSIRQTSHFQKKAKITKEGHPPAVLYPVMFKRKLWFNVNPGKDLVADLTFHFPQELPKYFKGYHTCTKEEMINLGGLLFRIKVNSNRSQFVMIPKMLKELVPADQIQIMTPEDWKRHIISSYNAQSGITVQEAKIAFLKAISRWPLFGCSFFEVKQTCETRYPDSLLVIMSKEGVSCMDPKTKAVLVMHPFSCISEYHSKSEYFHMTISTPVKATSFVCETVQADTMEDLLRSYISTYERQRKAFGQRNNMLS